jgi:acetyl/propionyl-CoA carboxylase alpha subunit
MNTQTGKNGDIVTFTIFIHNSPDPVNAFGCEITYDPTSMIYTSVQRGALISNGFRFFQASNVGFGRIRMGGIETGDNIIPKQAFGSLAFVQFRVIGHTTTSVRLENLKDDFKTWTTQHGQLIIQSEETDDDAENDITNSENDISEKTYSDSQSNEKNEISSQSGTIPATTIRPKTPNIVTMNDTQTKSTNSSIPSQSSNIHQTIHRETSQTSHQLITTKNQQIAPKAEPIQKHSTNNVSHKQQSTDKKNEAQSPFQQQDLHNNKFKESLTKRDLGYIKSVDVSAGMHQPSAISQNHLFTFPSFLSGTIVLSMIVQIGILAMLFLIYRQLIKNERG